MTTQKHKDAVTELIKAAIKKLKPKTPEEMEAIIQTVLMKYESRLNDSCSIQPNRPDSAKDS